MNLISNDEMRKKYAKIVAKAWADDDYKKKLIASPKEILKQEGIELPDKIKIRIFENTDTELNFVFPAKPETLSSISEIEERLSANTLVNPTSGITCTSNT